MLTADLSSNSIENTDYMDPGLLYCSLHRAQCGAQRDSSNNMEALASCMMRGGSVWECVSLRFFPDFKFKNRKNECKNNPN